MTTLALLVAMALGGIGLIIYALVPGKQQEQETIARRMVGKSTDDDPAAIQRRVRASMTARMMQKVAPIAVRPAMPKNSAEMSKLRVKLAAAGYRQETAPTLFLTSKTLLAIAVAIAVAVYSISRGNTMQHVMGVALFGTAMGFMAPNLWLSASMKKRAERIRNGLPDALDLLVISVESGLALDGAIQRVGDELANVHPELSEEFQIATLEVQMGIPRHETLSNMSDRTGLAEIRSLVAIVNQAEKFGTSISKALRHQADAMRVKRRQAAEERAQKTATKLMAPLILFIFPAIFVVLVGPAALRMIELAKSNHTLFG